MYVGQWYCLEISELRVNFRQTTPFMTNARIHRIYTKMFQVPYKEAKYKKVSSSQFVE